MSDRHVAITGIRILGAGYLTMCLILTLIWWATDTMPKTLADMTIFHLAVLLPMLVVLVIAVMLIIVIVFLIFYKLLGGD